MLFFEDYKGCTYMVVFRVFNTKVVKSKTYKVKDLGPLMQVKFILQDFLSLIS